MSLFLAKLDPAHERKLSNLLKDGRLIPILNNTKWRELISEMREAPSGLNPQFRGRSIFAPPGFVTRWDGDWYHHINPVGDIEWLEVRAGTDEWLLSVLGRRSIPFSIESGTIRIWGYVRPDAQPQWLAA